jgi:hypothetical protein
MSKELFMEIEQIPTAESDAIIYNQQLTAVQANGTFDSKFGMLYKFEYEFEDGTILTANHKDKEGFLKVGEVAEYEVTKEHPQYGKSGKVSRSKNGFTSSTPSTPVTNWRAKDVAIIYQNALTQANQLMANFGDKFESQEKALVTLKDYADDIARFVIKKSGI